MVRFSDAHRAEYGVESICTQLPIAPSTYYTQKGRDNDPEKYPRRWWRDAELKVEIRRVWADNFRVCDVRNVWRQLQREGIDVARCTVERLMRQMGLRGVVRGRTFETAISDGAAQRPADNVNRAFTATRANQLWVADLNYVATWRDFVYAAFVIYVYARMIVAHVVQLLLGLYYVAKQNIELRFFSPLQLYKFGFQR